MVIVVFIVGLLTGFFLNWIINRLCHSILPMEKSKVNIFVISTSGLLFLIAYLLIGLNMLFIKAAVLISILIIVSFVDLKHQIIPDSMVVVTLILGVLFIFIGDISLKSSLAGMLAGGVILFLLALVPNAIGGGDIKIMFALGLFLGFSKTIYAIILAFMLSAFIIIFLLLFKIKGRKDYIPFGPFLALGSLIAFMIL